MVSEARTYTCIKMVYTEVPPYGYVCTSTYIYMYKNGTEVPPYGYVCTSAWVQGFFIYVARCAAGRYVRSNVILRGMDEIEAL